MKRGKAEAHVSVRFGQMVMTQLCLADIMPGMIHLHRPIGWFGIVLFCSLAVRAAESVSPTSQPALAIVGGPYLQAPSPMGMTIVWTTNRKCVSKVEYGPLADDLSKTARSVRHGLVDANTTLHRVTLSGLSPGTTWYYRVVSTEIVEFHAYKVKFGQSVAETGQFTTLDPDKKRFSFCVLNDRHDHAAELRKGLGSIEWEGVDLVVGLGDMMNDPASEQQIFQNFINPCTEFFAGRIPLVLVRGNHEARGALARNLMDYFPTESGRYYYSFDHGGVHFLLLDAGEDKDDTSKEYSGLVAFNDYLKQETRWLEKELASSAFRNARFRVCLLHIPPVAYREDDPSKFIRAPWVRDQWNPMLSKAGLDLMISGHTHRYTELPADEERAFPIVVGGTETVIRVDVSPEQMEMKTFHNDGKLQSQPPPVVRKKRGPH